LIGALAGLLSGFLIIGTGDLILLAVTTSFGAISALIPDLDTDASKGKQILDFVFISFAFYLVYFSGCKGELCMPDITAVSAMALIFFAFLGVYFIFFKFFKPSHRGVTHTLAACLGFGILTYLFAGQHLALAGTVGYFSHLVADRQITLI